VQRGGEALLQRQTGGVHALAVERLVERVDHDDPRFSRRDGTAIDARCRPATARVPTRSNAAAMRRARDKAASTSAANVAGSVKVRTPCALPVRWRSAASRRPAADFCAVDPGGRPRVRGIQDEHESRLACRDGGVIFALGDRPRCFAHHLGARSRSGAPGSHVGIAGGDIGEALVERPLVERRVALHRFDVVAGTLERELDGGPVALQVDEGRGDVDGAPVAGHKSVGQASAEKSHRHCLKKPKRTNDLGHFAGGRSIWQVKKHP